MKTWKTNKSFTIQFPMGSKRTFDSFGVKAALIKDKLYLWMEHSCTLERIMMEQFAKQVDQTFTDIKFANRTGRYYIIVEDEEMKGRIIKWLEK